MSDPPIPYALRELDLAIDAYNTGNYEDAVQHGLSSFKGFDRLQDLDGRADVSRILGGAYLQTGDLANAHNFALGSLRDFERAKDDAGMGYALTLLGDIAQEKSLFEEANDYYRQALSHQALSHMEWSRDFWQIVVTSLNRANALQALGRDADANDMRARVQNLIEQPTARETPQRHVPLITRHTLSIRHAT